MRTKSIRLFGLVVLTGLFGMTQAVHADEVAALTSSVGPQGFIAQLPTVDSDALAVQLNVLRSSQIKRKQELAAELAEKKLDSGDAILTLLMPGGLAYAAYKKACYEHTRHDLEEASEDIAGYSSDLELLQGQMSPVAVAQLK